MKSFKIDKSSFCSSYRVPYKVLHHFGIGLVVIDIERCIFFVNDKDYVCRR